MGDIKWDDEQAPAKSEPAPAKTIKWDDEGAPNMPVSYTNAASEMLKGGGRGFIGMVRAIGKGIAPAPGTIPQQYQVDAPGKQDLIELSKRLDSALAPAPDANDSQRHWGTAGEIVGGMFAPGAGMIGGVGKGTASLAPYAGQYIPQHMQEYVSRAADEPMFSNMGRRVVEGAADMGGRLAGVPWSVRAVARQALDRLLQSMRKPGFDPNAPVAIPEHVFPSVATKRLTFGLVSPYVVDSGIEDMPSRESYGKVRE